MKYTIAALIVLFCTGCWMDRGSSVGGPKAKHTETKKEFDDKGKVVTETTTTTEAQGPTSTGAATKTWTPPKMTVNSNGAEIGEGGGTFFDVASIQAAAMNMRFLYMIGGIAILAGAVLGFFVNWKLGSALAAGGAVLIGLTSMVSAYPWILIVPLVMLVAAGIWIVIDMRRGKRHSKALTTLVDAGDGNAEFKIAVEKHEGSDKTFRKTIRTVKQNNNI